MNFYFFILLFSFNFADCWGMKEPRKIINFNNQHLSSTEFEKKINEIRDKEAVTVLWAVNNKLTDVSVLKDLPNLEEIHLSKNDIEDVSVLLNNLKKLKHLYVNYNKIEMIPFLKNSSLEILFIDNNNIKLLDYFLNFKNLKQLSIISNPIDYDFEKNKSSFANLYAYLDNFFYPSSLDKNMIFNWVVQYLPRETAELVMISKLKDVDSNKSQSKINKIDEKNLLKPIEEKKIEVTNPLINLKELHEERTRRSEAVKKKTNFKEDFEKWNKAFPKKAANSFANLKFRQARKEHPKTSISFANRLYQCWQSESLVIPSSTFNFEKGNVEGLKKLLTKNNIIMGVSIFSDDLITPWTQEQAQDAYNIFKQRAKGGNNVHNFYKKLIYFHELSPLLKYAKKVLTSYLPADFNKINTLDFIKKGNPLGRIFTCNMIKQTIKEKKLLSVRVPQKFLILYDKNSKAVVQDKKRASQIINDNLKFSLINDQEVRVSENLGNYGLYVLAKKEVDHKEKVPFNKNAQKDLEVLVGEVPFDIGTDNIFADAQGNAIIIDTEFKGENAKSSLSKLNRYLNKK